MSSTRNTHKAYKNEHYHWYCFASFPSLFSLFLLLFLWSVNFKPKSVLSMFQFLLSSYSSACVLHRGSSLLSRSLPLKEKRQGSVRVPTKGRSERRAQRRPSLMALSPPFTYTPVLQHNSLEEQQKMKEEEGRERRRQQSLDHQS